MSTAKPSFLKSLVLRHESVLLLVIVVEIILFSMLGRRFLDGSNVSNIFRFSVETGLLALAMTPVILTGGIDLSVGSMMGLCAVCFGMLVNDAHFTPLLAGFVAVGIGATGGGLNALLIARLKLPPLIVTLGTFSLFRGLAEGLTKGAKSYSGFPSSFLALGNSEVAGLPAQVWILLAVAAGIYVLVHHTTFGRSFRAIGYSPEGSRYAGLPVRRNTGLVYVLAGTIAGLAAVIYVARLGEARANAGIGYELLAITAVVLGGTSIFGGSGTVIGTLFGYIAVAILNNGLSRIFEYKLFDQPIASSSRELGGMLTGVLLIVALAVTPLARILATRRSRRQL
jgi:rhamnose transport system permease protein